jgi:SAM-dependent methyltransferase
MESKNDYFSFYDERRNETYAHNYFNFSAQQHSSFEELNQFIFDFNLMKKTCLEIGSSGGFFQDLVEDYHGTDIAGCLSQYYHKPYRVSEGKTYPFENEKFDAIWTISVHEHIPNLQESLMEINRLLKPGGMLYFAPAWQCRPWAASGYSVRPYSDFHTRGKLIKLLIPLRNNRIWRGIFLIPKRIFFHIRFFLGKRYSIIRYKQLVPNYEKYWTTDSDACNHIDPHDAILWFVSNGFDCVSHPLHWRALTVSSGALVFKKKAFTKPPIFHE